MNTSSPNHELVINDLITNNSSTLLHHQNSTSSTTTPMSLDYMQLINDQPLIIGLQNSLLKVSHTINHGTTKLPSPSLPLRVNTNFKGKNKIVLLDDEDDHEFMIFEDNGTSVNIEQEHFIAPRRKARNTFGETSSIYRGVSRYTGRFEVFLWDNTNPKVKSKTIYVAGGYEKEEEAAKAYDLAALKVWGKSAPLNFPITDYEKDLEEMEGMTKTEYLHLIRRRSDGFAKGISCFRGVSRLTRNTKGKKWQARMGKGKGIRGIYLGTFETEEEAAKAYDVAVIRMKGLTAATNFELNQYDLKRIFQSKKLPIGKGASKMLKMTDVEDIIRSSKGMKLDDNKTKKRKKKKNNKKLPALQLNLDHDKIIHTKPNMINSSKSKQPMVDYSVLTSSARKETTLSSISIDNAQMFPNYYNQNPSSSSSLVTVNQQHMMYPHQREVIELDYSSYGMTTTGSSSSSAPALGFQSGWVMSDDQSHSEVIETSQNSDFGNQYYGLFSDNQYSPALQDLQLESFDQFFDNPFDEPNPSFQTNDMISTNPNPSFFQSLADGDTDGNLEYPFGSYLGINDQDDQGNNLAMATAEAGKEVETSTSSEYCFDFDDFFLDDNEDFQNFLQNPDNFN